MAPLEVEVAKLMDPTTDPTTLDLLVKFQTSIAALLGFTGVIVTLIVNARNTRGQVEDNRRHEQETLRRALLAELEMHRETIAKNAEQVRKNADGDNDGMYHPFLATPIFDQSMTRLGTLDLDNLKAVLNAFGVVRGFNRRLIFLTDDPAATLSDTTWVPAAKVKTLLRMLETLLPPVDAGIVALQK